MTMMVVRILSTAATSIGGSISTTTSLNGPKKGYGCMNGQIIGRSSCERVTEVDKGTL